MAVAAAVFAGARAVGNDYVFFAGYTVLQFVVLASAWNILGGYVGYVNFGSAAFFALGAYSTVFLHKVRIRGSDPAADRRQRRGVGAGRARHGLPDAAAARCLLRHRDAGAGRGAADPRGQLELRGRRAWRLCDPAGRRAGAVFAALHPIPVPGDAGARRDRDQCRDRARIVERSKLGYGFATIRDDELAAEASGDADAASSSSLRPPCRAR